jgi:hypothetical protein
MIYMIKKYMEGHLILQIIILWLNRNYLIVVNLLRLVELKL